MRESVAGIVPVHRGRPIDDRQNASERRLRDQAIGRKNWMFLGSAEAGPRAAVLCTVIAGAKRHRLEPWAYLHDVILQLSVDASPESLAGLLPDRWAWRTPSTS